MKARRIINNSTAPILAASVLSCMALAVAHAHTSGDAMPPSLIAQFTPTTIGGNMAKAKSKTPTAAVFIYGPPGSGKTQHADALCKHYGKGEALDYDHDTKPIPADAIIFLQEPSPNFPRAIAIADALREAGLAE